MGVPVIWTLVPCGRGERQALEAVKALQGHLRNAETFLDQLRPGDVLVFCLRKRLRDPDRVPALLARGVQLLQVAEGCRTNFPGISHPEVPFLGWGPSARVAGRQTRVVGAPVLEAVTPGPPLAHRDAVALVNYKFRDWSQDDRPLRDPWLKQVLAACKATGLRPVFSAHPLMRNLPAGIEMSSRPVAQLCAEAPVLISRPSTVVYEALLAGAQPFVLPTRGEQLVEFADPRGAFPLVMNGAELTAQITAWQTGEACYGAAPFLEAHIDRDPRRPASARIVAEIRAALWA